MENSKDQKKESTLSINSAWQQNVVYPNAFAISHAWMCSLEGHKTWRKSEVGIGCACSQVASRSETRLSWNLFIFFPPCRENICPAGRQMRNRGCARSLLRLNGSQCWSSAEGNSLVLITESLLFPLQERAHNLTEIHSSTAAHVIKCSVWTS